MSAPTPAASPPLLDAPTLWATLVKTAGIRVSTWDAELVQSMRRKLALGFGPIPRELASAKTSVEELVEAFLLGASSFSQMLAEILALMETHGARHAQQVTRIQFDFEGANRPHIDLTYFRETMSGLAQVASSLSRRGWDTEILSELWSLMSARLSGLPPAPHLGEWGVAYRDRQWPDIEIPRPAPSGDAMLDGLLLHVIAIAQAELAFLSTVAPDRDALRAFGRDDRDPAVRQRAQMESDAMIGALVSGAHRAAAAKRTGHLHSDWEAELGELLASLQLDHDPIEAAVDQLLDVLALPTWKLRSELFAVWVLARTVAALDAWAPTLKVENETLHMPFRPELMATAGPLVIWSEFRMPLIDPWGDKRLANVQPDLVVARCGIDPQSEPQRDDVLLVIEAKQHWKAKQKEWGYALADYGRAFPKATVLVVSHARARTQTVFYSKSLTAEARNFLSRERPRLEIISHVAPEQSGDRRLATVIQTHAAKLAVRPVVDFHVPYAVGSITLFIVVHGRVEYASGLRPADASSAPHWDLWSCSTAPASAPGERAYSLPPGPYELWVGLNELRGEHRCHVAIHREGLPAQTIDSPLLDENRCWRIGQADWAGNFAADSDRTDSREPPNPALAPHQTERPAAQGWS